MDDDLPAWPRQESNSAGPAVIGADLSRLSVDEIGERIAALKAEIVRLEEALATKSASRAAAEAAFKLGR